MGQVLQFTRKKKSRLITREVLEMVVLCMKLDQSLALIEGDERRPLGRQRKIHEVLADVLEQKNLIHLRALNRREKSE